MEAVQNKLMALTESLRTRAKSVGTDVSSSSGRASATDGFFENERRLLGIDCAVCKNTGFVHFKKDGKFFAERCDCMTEYYNKQRIKRSGLINVLDIYTFDRYKTVYPWQKAVKDEALRFLEQTGAWFYVGGSVGSGKSHICTAICGELLKKHDVHYMPWRDDIVQIKANVTNDEEYQRMIQKPKTASVLYIDDFLKGRHTDADINVAFEIINHRYLNRFTTIISSEKSIDDIIEIDDAVGSRIYQMASAFELTIEGKNKNIRLERYSE